MRRTDKYDVQQYRLHAVEARKAAKARVLDDACMRWETSVRSAARTTRDGKVDHSTAMLALDTSRPAPRYIPKKNMRLLRRRYGCCQLSARVNHVTRHLSGVGRTSAREGEAEVQLDERAQRREYLPDDRNLCHGKLPCAYAQQVFWHSSGSVANQCGDQDTVCVPTMSSLVTCPQNSACCH